MRLVLLSLLLASCGDPPPTTTCTGPDPGTGTPVERLPFDSSGLGADCDVDGQNSDGSTVTATVARSQDELLALLGCTDGAVSVDFAHEEVIVIDDPDTIAVDGLFDVKGTLVVATSTGPAVCRGAAPQVTRAITALQRTGDDVTPAQRACVTVDPPPPSLFPPAPCLAP